MKLSVGEIKEFIKKPDLGRVGNGILYKMCIDYPLHKDDSEIIAKVWLIGRSYAVSLERGGNYDNDVSDDFYKDKIAPKFKKSFDNIVKDIRGIKSFGDRRSISAILKSHRQAIDFIKEEITKNERRSFAAKYLHFHFPDLFFIYDSRVANIISSVAGRLSKENKEFIKSLSPKDYDKNYAEFFLKCREIFTFAKENGVKLSPRQIDNFLISKANEKFRNKNK